jgi:NAD(P)-dependent dehydrogenase (short-subunit alcohol dehydrogenase family)
VTGAASGIGRAIADDPYRLGWTTALLDVKPIRDRHDDDRRCVLHCDISDEESTRQASSPAGPSPSTAG